MNLNKKLILVIIIAVVAVFVLFNLERFSCMYKGGEFHTGWPYGRVCNLPTSDAGKECSDSDECEGDCIAELPNEFWRNLPEEPIYTTGNCSYKTVNVGCLAFVEDGKVDMICYS